MRDTCRYGGTVFFAQKNYPNIIRKFSSYTLLPLLLRNLLTCIIHNMFAVNRPVAGTSVSTKCTRD
jgi:hypothetical protein